MRDRAVLGVDLLLAVGVAVLAVAGVLVAPAQPGFRDPDVGAVVLSVCQGTMLVGRRRFPGPVLVAVLAATLGFFAVGYPPLTTALIGALVALYSVTAYGTTRIVMFGAVSTAVAAGLLVVIMAVRSVPLTAGEVAVLGLALLTAGVLGDRMRTRRAYLRELEERNRRLEADRERQAEAAVAEERARIARELHDVVAHGVSVIVLHARAAKEVMASDPQALRRSLDLIEETGREAMNELRTILGVLRTDAGGDRALRPQPGVENLDTLVRQTGEAGLTVEVRTEGEPRPLPPGVSLSAYRIVQQSLTNSLTHSTATKARVILRYGPEELLVQVVDDGEPKDDAEQGGHGLVGMRERIGLFGGRLIAERRPQGGFEIVAVLPLDRGRR